MRNVLLLMLVCLSVVCSAAEISGTVTKVVDGDTFVINNDGDKFRVRMAHIDAPESSQPYGDQSKAALAAMIESKKVYVVFHSIDTFGRIVGEVYLAKILGNHIENVNKAMVARGWAYWFKEFSKDMDYLKLQEEAKINKRGVWFSQDTEYPWDYRARMKKEKRHNP